MVVARRIVGIDVGGTKTLGIVVDPAAPTEVLAESRIATPRGGAALIAALGELVRGLDRAPAAVGIGAAGLVDRAGVLRYGPNLPGATDLALADLLGDLAPRVAVENDNTCAAWAEARAGAATGESDVVFVGLGTGLGAGFVVAGELIRGAQGFAGEAGHITVVPDGVACVCGRRGCWERYASGAALSRFAAEHGGPVGATGEEVVAAARTGGAGWAVDAVGEVERWTAHGVGALVDLFDPGVVVLGGGVGEALGDALCEAVAGRLGTLVVGGGHRRLPRIRPAALGNRAAAIGAALVADGR